MSVPEHSLQCPGVGRFGKDLSALGRGRSVSWGEPLRAGSIPPSAWQRTLIDGVSLHGPQGWGCSGLLS